MVTTHDTPDGCTGLSAAGMSFSFQRIAARFPDAFDDVRRDLGAATRAEYPLDGRRSDDTDEIRECAARHRAAWKAVQGDSSTTGD